MAMLRDLVDAALTRPDLAALVCLGMLAVFFIRSQRRHVKGKPLPRPRGLPLLGNALQIGEMPWFQMAKWSKELGTSVTFRPFRDFYGQLINACRSNFPGESGGTVCDRPKQLSARSGDFG